MSKRTSQLEAELRRLSSDATTNLYRRLEISAALLADADWLAMHQGSLDEGEKYLANSYFVEYRGLLDFAELHAMFLKFPKPLWEEHRYDIGAMQILYAEAIESPSDGPQPTRKKYKQLVGELETTVKELHASLAAERRMGEAYRKEAVDLQQRVRELERENAELLGRVRELEKMVNRGLVSV